MNKIIFSHKFMFPDITVCFFVPFALKYLLIIYLIDIQYLILNIFKMVY